MQPDCPTHLSAIVVGYGPVGRYVTDELEADGYCVTIIERNEGSSDIQAGLNRLIVTGDAADSRVLEEAGIVNAETLIVTVPNEDAAVSICQKARELNPQVFITARANHLSYGMLCRQAGADHVIVEEMVAAEAMRQAVHQHVEQIDRREDSSRRRVKRQAG